MKILFLSHKFFPDIGGIEINSEILADAFSQAGHTVHLITWSDNNENSGQRSFPFLIIRNPKLLLLIKEHAWADVVFENNPCLRLAWQRLFFGKPSVIALNTWISRVDGSLGLPDRLKFLWLKKASKIIAVSNAVRQRCWPNSIVITNPYLNHIFRIYPNVHKNKNFVFLGRLVSDKGADQAIKAIKGFITSSKSKITDFKPLLTIIGDGPELFNLQRLITDLNLENYVFFAGALRGVELARCLNEHRFILVPSVWEEPFGNVVLEGMACGCVPIVSDGGGLPEAVGNAGLTYRRGDVDDLVKCINSIYNNPEYEQQYRNAAANHLKSHSPEFVSKRYLRVIEDAITQG